MGAVNHWITAVVHKDAGVGVKPQIYLLDSANLDYLDKVDEQLPGLIELRSQQHKAIVGGKPTSDFMMKMTIHSLFDQRKALEIIIDIFQNG